MIIVKTRNISAQTTATKKIKNILQKILIILERKDDHKQIKLK